MKSYQLDFIKFALENEALKFGEFKLKSGRHSPYFFNAGMFNDGNSFYRLANFYSDAIHEYFNEKFDLIFGPAYKGIALATAASIGLQMKYNQNLPVSFNRKEAKDHGEGGFIIGSPLINKRILLVDDVITGGITIRESLHLINAAQGKLVGVLVALDRQEQGLHSHFSAIQEVEHEFNIPIRSIINLENLMTYLQTSSYPEADYYLDKILAYQRSYGIHGDSAG